jgi:hypothetical protein
MGCVENGGWNIIWYKYISVGCEEWQFWNIIWITDSSGLCRGSGLKYKLFLQISERVI